MIAIDGPDIIPQLIVEPIIRLMPRLDVYQPLKGQGRGLLVIPPFHKDLLVYD